MTRVVEFFFDFGSPAVYLAAMQLPKIADQAGAKIEWRPMLRVVCSKPPGTRARL